MRYRIDITKILEYILDNLYVIKYDTNESYIKELRNAILMLMLIFSSNPYSINMLIPIFNNKFSEFIDLNNNINTIINNIKNYNICNFMLDNRYSTIINLFKYINIENINLNPNVLSEDNLKYILKDINKHREIMPYFVKYFG